MVTVPSAPKNLDLIFIFAVAEGEPKSEHMFDRYPTTRSYQQLLDFVLKKQKGEESPLGFYL